MFLRVLVLAFAMSPCMALADSLPSQPHIYVHGKGSVDFAPESVVLKLEYAATSSSAEESKRLLGERISSILGAARELEIPDKEITAGSAVIDPDIEYLEGEYVQTGIQASRSVRIRLQDLGSYAQLAQSAYASNPTSMSTELLGEAETHIGEAQRAAVRHARRRADMLAESMGMEISGVYSLSEFDFREEERYTLHPSIRISSGDDEQVTFFRSSELNAGAGDAFLAGFMTATATVYAVYLIQEVP